MLCATHSPVLAALPGATILELDACGVRATTRDELELTPPTSTTPTAAFAPCSRTDGLTFPAEP